MNKVGSFNLPEYFVINILTSVILPSSFHILHSSDLFNTLASYCFTLVDNVTAELHGYEVKRAGFFFFFFFKLKLSLTIPNSKLDDLDRISNIRFF